MHNIINRNRFNQDPVIYSCEKCKTVDALMGSYIALVEEGCFLENPNKYINNSYDKSEKDGAGYAICKER